MSFSVLTHSCVFSLSFPHFSLPVVPPAWGESAFPSSLMLPSLVRGGGLNGGLDMSERVFKAITGSPSIEMCLKLWWWLLIKSSLLFSSGNAFPKQQEKQGEVWGKQSLLSMSSGELLGDH